MKKNLLAVSFIFTGNFFALAADAIASTETIFGNIVNQLLNPIFTLLIVITATYFLFGVAVFIYDLRGGSKDEDLNNGKRHMLWGGIGLLIIMSISGIIKLLNTMFNGIFNF